MNDILPQVFLPRYEVLEPLGEGAVATVYKVRAQKDEAVYALKALKPRHARTTRSIGRFEDEFRILRRLHHPSLPEMYDYGIANDGTRYMVMERVEGVPLDRYFPGHKDELWLLVYQLTEALAFVHEHGLLHLDLKPGNTLVKRMRSTDGGERPMVVLIDFGLSYERGAGGEAKMSGTPDYMAPEIIRGGESLTRAADYYSLGVILYELVEKRTPFEGEVHDILHAHLTKRPRFAETKVEYAELYPWIERLLDKEVGERLDAFQGFRRVMADRVGDAPADLERAYALGYIESLGLIGKGAVRKGLG
ncbi:MAG: serine/threonine protein kinase, partial [Candidatus Krumholzibacteriia bacterium]